MPSLEKGNMTQIVFLYNLSLSLSLVSLIYFFLLVLESPHMHYFNYNSTIYYIYIPK